MTQQQILQLEAAIHKNCPNIGGIAVNHHSERVYEEYFGGASADSGMHVFSVTKSIVSLLIGIALDDGMIESVKQPVLDFFPDYTPKRGEKTLQKVTLEDMLCMRAPYKYKSAPYTRYFTSEDWVKTALDLLGGKGNIGDFRYAGLIGPDIICGILASASGMSTLEFARTRLFEPLGIDGMKNVIFESKEDQFAWYKAKLQPRSWVADPQGVNTAGWGLVVTADDMARLGQLCLDGGMWDGKRIVSREWIERATSEHIRCKEWGDLPYGYLWWLDPQREHAFAAMGDGGNIIYVDERRELVVAIAAFFKPRVLDRMDFIKEQILPLLDE